MQLDQGVSVACATHVIAQDGSLDEVPEQMQTDGEPEVAGIDIGCPQQDACQREVEQREVGHAWVAQVQTGKDEGQRHTHNGVLPHTHELPDSIPGVAPLCVDPTCRKPVEECALAANAPLYHTRGNTLRG